MNYATSNRQVESDFLRITGKRDYHNCASDYRPYQVTGYGPYFLQKFHFLLLPRELFLLLPSFGSDPPLGSLPPEPPPEGPELPPEGPLGADGAEAAEIAITDDTTVTATIVLRSPTLTFEPVGT